MDYVAQQTASGFIHMQTALLQFPRYDRRNKRVRVYLSVRMMEGNAHGFALVFKREDVFYKRVFLELFESVSPDPNKLVYLLDGLGRERRVVIGRIQNYFAYSDRRLDLINAVALYRRSIRIALKARKSVLERYDVVVGFRNLGRKTPGFCRA